MATLNLGSRAIPVDAETLYARARTFQPRIAALAPHMEKARQLDADLIASLDEAGLFSVMVPRRWGGAGLGIVEAAGILRILAQADICTAWNASFYMLTGVLLSRFPMHVQAQFFARKPSFLCAALMAPSGAAERVPGGYRLSGRWPYASGSHHAEGVLLPSMLEGEPWSFILPRGDVGADDDWDVSAMGASGSVTLIANGAFVPEDWAMPSARLASPDGHHGLEHPEAVLHYPFVRLGVISTALAIGALETAVAIGKERLATSRPMGVPRIDRPAARMRWAEAAQTLRMTALLHEAALQRTTAICERKSAWTTEEMGQYWLDNLSIFHSAKDALRVLVDTVGGSSIYKSAEPLQRMTRDIGMICTHLVIADYDVLWERGSRLVLGMDLAPGEF